MFTVPLTQAIASASLMPTLAVVCRTGEVVRAAEGYTLVVGSSNHTVHDPIDDGRDINILVLEAN